MSGQLRQDPVSAATGSCVSCDRILCQLRACDRILCQADLSCHVTIFSSCVRLRQDGRYVFLSCVRFSSRVTSRTDLILCQVSAATGSCVSCDRILCQVRACDRILCQAVLSCHVTIFPSCVRLRQDGRYGRCGISNAAFGIRTLNACSINP